jgi:hypothetical protein
MFDSFDSFDRFDSLQPLGKSETLKLWRRGRACQTYQAYQNGPLP